MISLFVFSLFLFSCLPHPRFFLLGIEGDHQASEGDHQASEGDDQASGVKLNVKTTLKGLCGHWPVDPRAPIRSWWGSIENLKNTPGGRPPSHTFAMS